MNGVVRTTISMPIDLYESLRLQAYQDNISFSGILAKKLAPRKLVKPGSSLMQLAGKYSVKKFKVISREELYDDYFQHKMSSGH